VSDIADKQGFSLRIQKGIEFLSRQSIFIIVSIATR